MVEYFRPAGPKIPETLGPAGLKSIPDRIFVTCQLNVSIRRALIAPYFLERAPGSAPQNRSPLL